MGRIRLASTGDQWQTTAKTAAKRGVVKQVGELLV